MLGDRLRTTATKRQKYEVSLYSLITDFMILSDRTFLFINYNLSSILSVCFGKFRWPPWECEQATCALRAARMICVIYTNYPAYAVKLSVQNNSIWCLFSDMVISNCLLRNVMYCTSVDRWKEWLWNRSWTWLLSNCLVQSSAVIPRVCPNSVERALLFCHIVISILHKCRTA